MCPLVNVKSGGRDRGRQGRRGGCAPEAGSSHWSGYVKAGRGGSGGGGTMGCFFSKRRKPGKAPLPSDTGAGSEDTQPRYSWDQRPQVRPAPLHLAPAPRCGGGSWQPLGSALTGRRWALTSPPPGALRALAAAGRRLPGRRLVGGVTTPAPPRTCGAVTSLPAVGWGRPLAWGACPPTHTHTL